MTSAPTPEEIEAALNAYQRVMLDAALKVSITDEPTTAAEARLAEHIFKARQRQAMSAAIQALRSLAPDNAGRFYSGLVDAAQRESDRIEGRSLASPGEDVAGLVKDARAYVQNALYVEPSRGLEFITRLANALDNQHP